MKTRDCKFPLSTPFAVKGHSTMKQYMFEAAIGITLVCSVSLSSAGEVGKVSSTVDMKNSAILAGSSGVTQGSGSNINSVVVGTKGKIKGDVAHSVTMKNSAILANGGSNINSVVVQ